MGFTFDVGHAYGTANWLKKEPYKFMESMIKSAGPGRVKNIHITDIAQGVDFHMAIGRGTIDFKKVFRVLSGYTGPVILENFPEDIFASIEEIRVRYPVLDAGEPFNMEKIRAFAMRLDGARSMDDAALYERSIALVTHSFSTGRRRSLRGSYLGSGGSLT